MGEIWRRVRYLLSRGRRDAELAGDMAFHREMAEREGRRFNGELRLREESREAWGWTWLDRCGQDVRYAARILRRSPGFTLAAVLTLALGIGVNVAAFGFFDLFALRPLPVREPETLLRFERRSPKQFATHVPYAALAFYREHSRALATVLAQYESRLAIDGQDKPARAMFVSGNYLADLGAPASLGRMIDPARDDAAGAEPVVVLSYWFWQRAWGSDAGVVGRTIRINGKPATVVGVAGPGFSGLTSGSTDMWLPVTRQPLLMHGSRLLTDFTTAGGVEMWGRLQPGVSLAAAEDELRMLAAELRKQHPGEVWENEHLAGTPGAYAMSAKGRMSMGSGAAPDKRRQVYLAAGLAGTLVFLILAVACGNLGGLLLARGAAREREIAIRSSVGAGRGRLVRQLFTESLLLALMGSAAGLALGSVAMRYLMSATDAPAWLDPSPDWRVVLFALGAGFVAAVLFGLTPALQVASLRRRTVRLRQVLVGTQVAASCVLLIVAGLLVRALDRAFTSHPGFDYQHAISIDPRLVLHGYGPEKARAYLESLKSRLRALPGVESVALASCPPLGRKSSSAGLEDGGAENVYLNFVDSEFLRTMKIPLLQGRALEPGDRGMVVISESLARRRRAGGDAMSKPLKLGGTAHTVVGIAGNARGMAMRDPDAMEAYFPIPDDELPGMSVVVRTTGPPESVAPQVAAVARAVDERVFPEMDLMPAAFERSVQPVQRGTLAVSLLGGVALVLACLGIVGMVAYAVSQRTKEIGIRMALGCARGHVLDVVLRQFWRPVGFGLVAGVGAAAALSQVLRRQLYGVSHLDPAAYAAAVGLFLAMALLAALLPARRALRIDPMRALRHE